MKGLLLAPWPTKKDCTADDLNLTMGEIDIMTISYGLFCAIVVDNYF